jgi:predicted acylesterase/phospholipase RssA
MQMKRAIALAGGGPAVGLSLGALKRLHEEPDIQFDVWSCACIGAWLGVYWNQATPGQEFAQSKKFFEGIFRPDPWYAGYPMATVFAPDFQKYITSVLEFVTNPASYQYLVVPDMIQQAAEDLFKFSMQPQQWSQGNLNSLIYNSILAPNPLVRFMTSAMYLSPLNGLARIWYPQSAFLDQINFAALAESGKPAIYHNAYNLTDQRLELFSNRQPELYLPITGQTLCACSALPYIEEPVEMNGKVYCEGATVDTVNFEDLLRNHPDLDEVWVSRILDRRQIHRPKNMLDALNNLVMLFAATTSEDDVKLFKFHIQETGANVRVVEIPVAANVDYNWTWSNLHRGIDDGYAAASATLLHYRNGTPALPSPPPQSPEIKARMRASRRSAALPAPAAE